MKKKIAIVRGKFLNQYEMQAYEALIEKFNITAFGSYSSFHTDLSFPVKKLPSPMDLPEFPFKMQLLNRMFTDAHCLFGLEDELFDFDIVHTAETYFHYTKQVIDLKRKGQVKRVVITTLENIPFANEGIRGRKNFKKIAYEYADLFLATTQDAKNALIKEGVDRKKIRVIGSGVETKRFLPKKRNTKVINILFVGRLEREKGVHNVISSYILLSKQYKKKIHLTIVGRGSEKKKIRKRIKENDLESSVTLKTVAYKDIHVQYQNADIFVAPSIDTLTWKEQFGYVIVEAMSSGLPIITTDAGSIPEVIKGSGLIIPQNDTLALTNSLDELIKSKQKRVELGKKARRTAVKYYDHYKVAKKIEKIYTSLL